MLSRRDMLRLGLGAAALSVVSVPGPVFAREFACPVGVEMYGVRKAFAEKPAETMEALAAAGFQCVEYASGHPISTADRVRYQKATGLVCSGSHMSREEITNPERLKQTIDTHLELGAKFLICAWMQNADAAAWAEAGKQFSEAAAVAKEHGLSVGYHAHGHDFTPLPDGRTPWEVFAENSSQDVVLQMDTANCPVDCVRFIEKYPGRSRSVHLKEKGGVLGQGSVPWPAVFEACEKVGGVQVYIIEHEPDHDRALEENIACLQGLKRVYDAAR